MSGKRILARFASIVFLLWACVSLMPVSLAQTVDAPLPAVEATPSAEHAPTADTPSDIPAPSGNPATSVEAAAPDEGTPATRRARKRNGRASGAAANAASPSTLLLELSPSLRLTPGVWSRYRFEDKLTRRVREIEVGVAGPEPSRSSSAVWLEITTESRSGVPVVLRILYDPENLSAPPVHRLIVKTGDHPPVELRPAGYGYTLSQKHPGRYVELGKERLEVEAGRFDAVRGRYSSSGDTIVELWSHQRVAPLGIVRAMSSLYDLELLEHGRDYEARVIEEPIPLREPESIQMRQSGQD